jgi:uncharacterized repeat protein (TIGR03803 family)
VAGKGLSSFVCLALGATAAAYSAAKEPGSFRLLTYPETYGAPNGLVEASPGVFYTNGGSAGPIVFSVTAAGSSAIVANLPAGHYIQAALVAAANGRFYSSMAHRLDPVSMFSTGTAPNTLETYSPQPLDPMPTQNLPDGSLLAISATLSANPRYSLVRCGLDGKVTLLHQFPAGERLPHTALYATDGNYYGVSMLPDGSGYVYSWTPPETFKKLTTFPADSLHGYPAFVPLLEAEDGNLYGATTRGGAGRAGTIYKLSPTGGYTLLYSFPHKQSSFSPTALIEASDGNLYGMTLGEESELFRISKSGQFTVLYTMDMLTQGRCPCQLIQASDGSLYGTASLGGTAGLGNIFVWNGGLPKPRPQALEFQPASAAPGAEVLIWGSNLLTAQVSFNGVSAAHVSAIGPNYIRATVPGGATSGPLTISTPGGSTKTHVSLTIVKR